MLMMFNSFTTPGIFFFLTSFGANLFNPARGKGCEVLTYLGLNVRLKSTGVRAGLGIAGIHEGTGKKCNIN